MVSLGMPSLLKLNILGYIIKLSFEKLDVTPQPICGRVTSEYLLCSRSYLPLSPERSIQTPSAMNAIERMGRYVACAPSSRP